jgi:hypothetical protein
MHETLACRRGIRATGSANDPTSGHCRCSVCTGAAAGGEWKRVGSRIVIDLEPRAGELASDLQRRAELELEDLPPVTARLRWLQGTMTPDDVIRSVSGCGVYIAVDSRQGDLPLKVGVGRPFRTRMGDYRAILSTYPGLRFHVAHILSGDREGCGIGGVDYAVENAIARTLYRAGFRLPLHGEPRVPARVRGRVTIYHLLPPPLNTRLRAAYGAHATDALGQSIQADPYALPDPRRRSLILDRSEHKIWELE